MPKKNPIPENWYGSYELPTETPCYWQVGPLRFWLTHSGHEWRFAWLSGNDSCDPTEERDLTGGVAEPQEAEVNAHRLGFRKTPSRMQLVPLTADRPVVVKPSSPFLLPPGEELTLFISTVVWLQVQVGDPLKEFLQVPVFRPSDTWFGSSTREGEICYALSISARVNLENIVPCPHRAVSALRVRNKAAENLTIEKVLLQLPHMSLFAAGDGRLWTEAVTMDHSDSAHGASIQLGDGPPALAGKTRKISGPRLKSGRRLFTRAFSGLLGGGY